MLLKGKTMKELTRLAVVATMIASVVMLSVVSCLPLQDLPVFKVSFDYASYDPNCPPPPSFDGGVAWPCALQEPK